MQVRKPWIASKKGILFTRKCFALASFGGLCYELLPNSLLLPFKRAQQEEAMKARIGMKGPPYQVQEYVRKAIDDLKYTEKQRKALSVYLTDMNDVGTYGNVNSIFGTLVKLPYMLWNQYPIPDVIKGKPEEDHAEAYKQFHESLQWSDNAKLYFTAYQVTWITHYQFLAQGLFNAVGIMSAYTACYLMTSSRNRVTDRPIGALSISVVLLGMFGVTWLFATDLTHCENVESVIKEVCSLGPAYVEGAKELYTKMQQHNKAAREIVGFAGKVKYTEEGDINTSFRRPTVPLSERLVIIEKIAESYRNENPTSVDEIEKKKSSVDEIEKQKLSVDKIEEKKLSTDGKKEEIKQLTDGYNGENNQSTAGKTEENKQSKEGEGKR